ncbi:hypothetical protein NDA16_002881 [Ustilago loliicola]|nr:hypothetical protein NDA16_002881 [Ustilago loliicola]
MIAGADSHIDAIFHKGSVGTVATMFHEFADFDKLGKDSNERDAFGFSLKSYICTAKAVQQSLCTREQLGNFIVDESKGKATTVQVQRLDFGAKGLEEEKTLRYNVSGSGYYCWGASAVPLASLETDSSTGGDLSVHAAFAGRVEFFNRFKGNLPAAEYPKLNFYFALTIAYIALGGWWLSLCIKHKDELLTVQYFISGTIAFLIVEIAAQWVYYYYLNNHLIDFFRIREVNGNTGVTALDQGGAWILAFIFPLALTLTAFLTWIMNSLNHSIEYLTQRKQTFKRGMFVKLHRILVAAVVVIFAFFIISSWAFSQSGGEGFAPNTWRYRWFLLDGWLALLYLTVFAAIAWVWRPTGSNMRLAMSDELATEDDPTAEGYEVDTFAARGPDGSDSDDEDDVEAKKTSQGNAGGVGGSRGRVGQDEVVFEIGDEDDEADQGTNREMGGNNGRGERQGLMRGSANNSEETLVPPGKRADKND